MLSSQEKINRYEIIEQGLCNRLETLKSELAYDQQCGEEQISTDEWETLVADKIKQPADDLFGNEDVAFYLLDKMIEEQTGIISLPPKDVMQILNKEQTGICSLLRQKLN